MKVEYFIGIVPPEEYLLRIKQFQSRWIHKLGVEPHITLKAQGGLNSDKKWIDKVQRVCDNFKPFQVSINRPKYFGDNILYLSINSSNLHDLHQKIVQEVKFIRIYELNIEEQRYEKYLDVPLSKGS